MDEGDTYSLFLSSDANVTGWTVDWGDGTTGPWSDDGSPAPHVYLDGPTSHTILVHASDAQGAYTATADVTVANVAPDLAGRVYGLAVEGATASASLDSYYDPGDDTITHWSVDWGDGASSGSGDPSASLSHVYGTAGEYAATFTASDEDGSYTSTYFVGVDAAEPTLGLTATSAQATEGQAYSLSFSATFGVGGAPISDWTVDWGDGSSDTYTAGSAGTVGVHTYADGPAVYEAEVWAAEDGESYQIAETLAVVNAPPSLHLSLGQTLLNAGQAGATESVSFWASDEPGTDAISLWALDWGDGNTDTVTAGEAGGQRTHFYGWDQRTYSVGVRAVDEDGSYSASPSGVTVGDQPAPGSTGITEGDLNSYYYGASGTIGTDTHVATLDWGDGAITTSYPWANYCGFGGTHRYADNGSYTLVFSIDGFTQDQRRPGPQRPAAVGARQLRRLGSRRHGRGLASGPVHGPRR